jgi:hypothetical protein
VTDFCEQVSEHSAPIKGKIFLTSRRKYQSLQNVSVPRVT